MLARTRQRGVTQGMWKRRRRENKTREYPANLFELVTAFGYTIFEESKEEIQSTIVITLLNGVRSIIRNIQQTKSLSGETKGDSYRLFKLYGKERTTVKPEGRLPVGGFTSSQREGAGSRRKRTL